MENIDDYKDDARVSVYAWTSDRQIEDFYLPSHPGAIQYRKEIGIWKASPGCDFEKGWMTAREKR